MEVTKPCEFIGLGAMEVTKPYEFIRFGAMGVTKPYEFIGFGAVTHFFDWSSVRVPGPVPHPGFQKQQFTRNVGLFLGGPGPAFPAPSRRIGGSRGSRAGIQNIYF